MNPSATLTVTDREMMKRLFITAVRLSEIGRTSFGAPIYAITVAFGHKHLAHDLVQINYVPNEEKLELTGDPQKDYIHPRKFTIMIETPNAFFDLPVTVEGIDARELHHVFSYRMVDKEETCLILVPYPMSAVQIPKSVSDGFGGEELTSIWIEASAEVDRQSAAPAPIE